MQTTEVNDVHETLLNEMEKRGVSIGAIAQLLGLHRNSVRNKLYGISEFSVREAMLVHREYFADCCFCRLFAQKSDG